MLNIYKIESDINSKNLQSTDVSKIIGQKYTTTINRREKGNWTPNDVEKIAEFFKRPIAYYFDKEENEAKEPEGEYKRVCKECIEKDNEINRLKEKLTELQEKYISALEDISGKNGNRQCG